MSDNIYFNFSTAIPQIFPFPSDVIKYMVKNSNGPTWLKLTKSCKYFYTKRKALVLKSTTLEQDGSVLATDRSVHKFWETVDKIPCELFLGGKFNISGPLAILKPKILSCKLRELNICKTALGIEEFEYLADSEVLDTFRVKDAEIRYSDQNVVPLEEIFGSLPNVTCLAFDCNKSITDHTFRRMAETSRNRKLISFDFTGIQNINEKDFVLFTQNHAARNCHISLGNISHEFSKILDSMLEKWEPQSVKPTFHNRYTPFRQQQQQPQAAAPQIQQDLDPLAYFQRYANEAQNARELAYQLRRTQLALYGHIQPRQQHPDFVRLIPGQLRDDDVRKLIKRKRIEEEEQLQRYKRDDDDDWD